MFSPLWSDVFLAEEHLLSLNQFRRVFSRVISNLSQTALLFYLLNSEGKDSLLIRLPILGKPIEYPAQNFTKYSGNDSGTIFRATGQSHLPGQARTTNIKYRYESGCRWLKGASKCSTMSK